MLVTAPEQQGVLDSPPYARRMVHLERLDEVATACDALLALLGGGDGLAQYICSTDWLYK
jgi:hypothetical protein